MYHNLNSYTLPQPTDPITSFFNALGIPMWLVIGLLVAILIFLIIREILCWYWKINERLDILYKISENMTHTNALLRTLIKQLRGERPATQEQLSVTEPLAQVPPRVEPPIEKFTPPVTESESHFSESMYSVFSWIKSQLQNLSNMLVERKRSVTIMALVLVITACLIALATYAWMLWPIWKPY